MSARSWLVGAAVVLAATACGGGGGGGGDIAPTAGTHSAEQPADATHPQILAERSAGNLGTLRVADGVLPPTNRWYSSLGFADGCLPVYPRPLSVTPCDGSVSIGLTIPVASANAIIAAASDDITVSIDGAEGPGIVTHADSVGASVAMGPGTVTVAQGWPAVAIGADEALTARLSVDFAPVSDGVGVATVANTKYGIVITGGSIQGSTLSLDSGGTASLFAVPTGTDVATFAQAIGTDAPLTSVTWALDGDAATTTVTYAKSPTVVVVPQERAAASGLTCDLGTFATIDGTYAACRGASVSWDVPRLSPSDALSLKTLSADEKATLIATLKAETTSDPTLPGDTYFGSKALYRLANLVQVADALGEHAIGDRLAAQLEVQLRLWADPDGCAARDEKCFVYDPAAHGVIGLATSFGSEEFNDHHFHYGYLLYAAAVAGARDPGLVADIGPVLDLVADDVASPVANTDFPLWRTFDPVAGHSWASGTAPFGDGNNQESSSEAVAAWNGVALWREVRGESLGADAAQWMLSAEAEAARRIYLAPDLTAFPEFDHGTVGIEWTSKRDFATWFSAEPKAIIGIQLIPAPPVAVDYYRSVPASAVAASVDAARGAGSGTQFSDYLLMYEASASTAEADAAWKAALDLPAKDIDDANSRTYMLAWIAALRH